MKSSLKVMLLLGTLLPMLAACNTIAGIGKDLSVAGDALSNSAMSVKNAKGQPSNPGLNKAGAIQKH